MNLQQQQNQVEKQQELLEKQLVSQVSYLLANDLSTEATLNLITFNHKRPSLFRQLVTKVNRTRL